MSGPGAAVPVVDTRQSGGESCATMASRALDALAPGGVFELVADHDPRGLHYMFDAERPGEVSWHPVQDGPELWRVHVGRKG